MIQLRKVALYSREGEIRTIDFMSGSLNVITGEPMTGKSALLEIVEFCLGRTTVSLPEGALTQAVGWYAVLVEAGEHRALVARPGPTEGQASVAGGYLALGGPSLDFPPPDRLEANTNSEGITAELSRLCGIEEYLTRGYRDPFQPTIRHASFFCFQRQNEIANPTQLFHRQNEDYIPRAIRDTLPYFLGAANVEAPVLRQELMQLRRDLSQAERDLAAARGAAQLAPERGAGLIAEAIDTGLLTDEADPSEGLVARLRQAAEAPVSRAPPDSSQLEQFEQLRGESRELAQRLREIGERSKLLLESTQDRSDYQQELGEQAARLESLDILVGANGAGASDETEHDAPRDHSTRCPVCGSALEEADATVRELVEAAESVRAELGQVGRGEATRQDALSQLEQAADGIRSRMREVHQALSLLRRDRAQLRLLQDEENARAYVKGRIVHHLEELDRADPISTAELERRVETLRRSAEELEGRLDPDAEREQVVSRLNIIGDDMSRWAEALDLEHTGGRVRLDAYALTVVADTEEGPIPLERMGSAGNWVGYHLVTHLALHRWFLHQRRPVPRMIMIDQPTQAFYPPDVDEMSLEDIDDADRQAVTRMFRLLHEVAERLAPDLQIIVMDHANLDEDWFQRSIVEEWRRGAKLVPEQWLS
ncbi:MAG: DUF3732 domain-containing protein [Actinomycetota bacterium]|nr:DUF3732 domain-containing protein [Actinomycetota bacterium]